MKASSRFTTANSDFGESKLRKGIDHHLPLIESRMKESKVLVINLIGAATELCRHLVLSGINLELVNDGVVVEAHHA